MVGTLIGQYRIVELLGSGSMGVVYKAVDETLDREVAIEILNPELTGADLIRRFRTEATALAKLNHPEIATIYELRPTDQGFLMVMEFVRGEPLDKILERAGSLPVETVAYVVDRVLSALGHAHQAGIVHRDIKPANVMVTDGGGIKVMDFGIAFMRGASQSGAGGMLGTPGYMPPEQILGNEIDGRSDLYAVGVIFYRLLTGTFPFRASTIEEMLRKQLSGLPATPLNQYRVGLPSWCERIVHSALAKSPSDRFQTAAEFRSALKERTRAVPENTARLSVSELVRLGVARRQVAAAPSPERTVALDKTVALKRTGIAWKGAAVAITTFVVVALLYFAQSRLARERDSSAEPSVSTVPSTPSRFAPVLQPVVPSALTSAPSAVIPPPSPGKAAGQRANNTKSPVAANVSPVPLNASPSVERDAAPAAVPAPARAPSVFPPLVFDAKALVGLGDRQNEREVNVQLADGYFAVTAAASPNDVMYRQPYTDIGSIAYSLSRHPLWLSPNGPAPAARTGRVLGIFARARHWVTLRSADAADPPMIVLRFENSEQVKHVVSALTVRTGRTAVRVVEPKEPK